MKIRSWTMAVVFAYPLAASAQPLKYNEGPGIRLSDSLFLHPGAWLESDYDSNIFYSNSNAKSSPYLRFAGHLDLSPPSGMRLGDVTPNSDFRLHGALGYRNYISDDKNITGQNAIDADAGLRAAFNQNGAVMFAVSDSFQRLPLSKSPDLPSTFNRNYNVGGADLTFQPGGRALSAKVGYTFSYDTFDEKQAIKMGSRTLFMFDPQRTWHTISLGSRWKLLPKTAVVVDADARLFNRADDHVSDSTHMRAFIGLTTLVTPTFEVTLKPGFGHGSYDKAKVQLGDFTPTANVKSGYDTFLATAQLAWLFGERSRFELGYDRNADDATLGSFLIDDRPYATLKQRIGDRAQISIQPALRLRHYEGIPKTSTANALTSSTRDDKIIEVAASVDVRTVEWMYLGLAYYLTDDITDFQYAAGSKASFVKNVALARLEITY